MSLRLLTINKAAFSLYCHITLQIIKLFFSVIDQSLINDRKNQVILVIMLFSVMRKYSNVKIIVVFKLIRTNGRNVSTTRKIQKRQFFAY